MAMTRRNNAKDFGYISGTIEEFVPENHLVRKLEILKNKVANLLLSVRIRSESYE